MKFTLLLLLTLTVAVTCKPTINLSEVSYNEPDIVNGKVVVDEVYEVAGRSEPKETETKSTGKHYISQEKINKHITRNYKLVLWVSDEKRNYAGAQLYCEEQGGHLSILSGLQPQRAVESLKADKVSEAWVKSGKNNIECKVFTKSGEEKIKDCSAVLPAICVKLVKL